MTATYTKFTLQLNTATDADVIEYLSAQANKNNTMRQALRARMRREEQERDGENKRKSYCGDQPFSICTTHDDLV